MARKKKKSEADELRSEFDIAKGLYGDYLRPPSLPTLEAARSPEVQNLLNLRYGFADPASAAFAGRLDPATAEAVELARQRTDPTSWMYAGHEDHYTTRALKDYERAYHQAGTTPREIQDVINRFKGGLEGYTAAENTALREQASRGIDEEFRNQVRQAQAAAAGRGVRGASLGAQINALGRTRTLAEGDLQQDLFVKNIDEKYKRLGDYSNLVREHENRMFGRKDAARDKYQGLSLDTSQRLYDQRQNAYQDYMNRSTSAADTAYGRGQDAITNYQGTLGDTLAQERERDIFNIGQTEKGYNLDASGMLGILGLLETKRQGRRQDKILG